MTALVGPKISFSPTTLRVRVDFTRADCVAQPEPPIDLIKRAVAKMESIQKSGQIEFFISNEEKFKAAWIALAKSSEPDSTNISMNLAAGAPKMEGFTLHKASTPGGIFGISILANAETVKTWHPGWIKLKINHLISSTGAAPDISDAKLFSITHRLFRGEKIDRVPLSAPRAIIAAADPEDPYSLVANKSGREIVVVIKDPKHFQTKQTAFEDLIQQIGKTCQQMNDGGNVSYRILRLDLIQFIKSAINGPERVGLQLPMLALAAVGTIVEKSAAPGVATTASAEKKPTLLKFAIDRNNMSASIRDFDMNLYGNPKIKMSLDFIRAECAAMGITHGISDALMKPIKEAIDKMESLSGKIVAQGTAGTPSAQPYLHTVFSEIPKIDETSSDPINIRDTQMRTTVGAGQVICEIRYQTAARLGTDIFGKSVAPPAPEPFVVRVGENVQERERGKFYSLADGMPKIGTADVSVMKALIHPGDVNLKSGNIRFDGPAEIHGSIDTGSKVEVNGDLVIHGSVRGGLVICGGTITVHGGINTTESGRVRAKQNIVADFIENSNVECGGELKIKKNLLNSTAIAGVAILLDDPRGTLGGGYYSARKLIRGGNIGFKNGAMTELNVGVDYSIELAILLRKKRLEKINAKNNEDKLEHKEISSKRTAQLTKKHTDRKKILNKRLMQARRIIEKLEAKLQALQARVTFDSTARVIAHGTMSSNTKVLIGGIQIPIESDFIGVMVTGKMRRGTFIHALTEIAQENRAAQEAAKAKKAG